MQEAYGKTNWIAHVTLEENSQAKRITYIIDLEKLFLDVDIDCP